MPWPIVDRFTGSSRSTADGLPPRHLMTTTGQFNAYPCEKPVLNEYGMALLNGEHDAMLFHFPDHRIHQR